ncbi:Camphor resistance CrcB protein [gut metagenome]|uniref:Camphor resistance CrcB protein n=1 Tax=gut metagenome TaxID=749906 RepID=J9FT24_9ZZZZ
MKTMIHSILLVGVGSGIGGVLRYLLGRTFQSLFPLSFPWGTLVINALGCLAIGILCGFLARGGVWSESLRLFAVVGLCGGFTTFSTFSNESYSLWINGCVGQALAYSLLSVVIGFAMVILGYALSR